MTTFVLKNPNHKYLCLQNNLIPAKTHRRHHEAGGEDTPSSGVQRGPQAVHRRYVTHTSTREPFAPSLQKNFLWQIIQQVLNLHVSNKERSIKMDQHFCLFCRYDKDNEDHWVRGDKSSERESRAEGDHEPKIWEPGQWAHPAFHSDQ